MRHRKAGVKLNRTTSHRQAMFRNMVTSLFKHDRIRTTDIKAKELRRWADHIITLAKRGDLHARRQILAIVQEKGVAHKLFEEAGKRFGAISGGYTRIIKLGRRPGDAAPVSIIELVAADEKAKSKKKDKGGAKKKESVASSVPAAAVEKAAQKESVDKDAKAGQKDEAPEIEAAQEQTADAQTESQPAAEVKAAADEITEPAAGEEKDQDTEEPEKE
jgi:large subunit ribosomal protein L17